MQRTFTLLQSEGASFRTASSRVEKTPWAAFSLPVIAALISFALPREVQAAERPNIIFVLADDLGYGDLGCYGQKQIKTPHLDQMAEEGMRFTDFYAGSTVCAPSRCVLMTGYHTGHAFIRGNAKDNLRPTDITVAKLLQQAGYATCLAGKWGLGHEGSTGVPTKQGFDYFYGYLDQSMAHNYYPSFLIRNEQRISLRNIVPNEGKDGQGVASKKVEYSHDLVMNEALDFIDRNKQRPFFLYLALTIPHANNEAADEGMEVPDLGVYAKQDWPEAQKGHAAMITHMDTDIGKLIDRLKAHGIDDNTLLLFSSDNGPHDEGGNNPGFNNSSGPLKGIKRSLTEGGIRVPTIARWPGTIQEGTTTHFVGAFWDLLPTFADLAGVANAAPDDIDGISFVPTLKGDDSAQKKHDFLYWAFYEGAGAQAGRRDHWKAVQQPYHSAIRLYDLSTDMGEQHDVAEDHPRIVEEMQQRMNAAYAPSDRWRFPAPKNNLE